MLEAGLPVGVGVHQVELVAVLEMTLVRLLRQAVVGLEDGGLVDQVGAGLIEGDGIERGEHAQVGDDRGVVVVPAVALRRDVHDEADVEVRLVFQDSLGIFGDLVVQVLGGVPLAQDGALELAKRHALAAADAFRVVDHRLALAVEVDRLVAAMGDADVAAAAMLTVDFGLRGGVQLHLAGDARAAHAEVLERAAEAGLLVALEVVHRDDDVRVGDGRSDLRRLAILAVDLDLAALGAFQAVGDDHVALGRDRVEAILHGALQVVDSVRATAGVERVTIGQERLATQLADQRRQASGVVGADKGHVARLAEMDLDRHELVLEIDIRDSGAAHEALQLIEQVALGVRAQIGEINF